MPQVGEMRITFGDVRRVAQRQIKALAGERIPPVTAQQAHIETEPLDVALRDLEGGGARIDGADLGIHRAVLHGQCDGTAAGAEVDDTRCADRRQRSAQQLERPVDQRLGVGAWHQHIGIHFHGEAVELLDAADVGNRFARDAPVEEPLEPCGRAIADRRIGVGENRGSIGVEAVGQEQLGVQASRLGPGFAQPGDADVEQGTDRCHLPAGPQPAEPVSTSAARRSAWSVWLSVSIRRSSSPFSTRGRFERSIPTRWSVTRSCG